MKTAFYLFGTGLSILMMIIITFREITTFHQSISALVWGIRIILLFQCLQLILIFIKKIDGKISHSINQIFNKFVVVVLYLTDSTDYVLLLSFAALYSIFICFKCVSKWKAVSFPAVAVKYGLIILVVLLWYLQNSLPIDFIKINAQSINDSTVTVIRCNQLLMLINSIYQCRLLWRNVSQEPNQQLKNKVK